MQGKKLKSLLQRTKTASLLLSGIGYTSVFLLLSLFESWWAWIIYVIVCVYLYRKFFYSKKEMKWIGVGIITSSVWLMISISSPLLILSLGFLYGIIVALFIGLQLLIFEHEEMIISMLLYTVLYILFSLFLFQESLMGGVGKVAVLMMLFVASALMVKEMIQKMNGERGDIVVNIFSYIVALVSIQLLWIIDLFSFGSLYGASLVVVFLMLLVDTFFAHNTIQLGKRHVVQNIAFLLFFSCGVVLLSIL